MQFLLIIHIVILHCTYLADHIFFPKAFYPTIGKAAMI